MLAIWTVNTGTSLGILEERQVIDISLPTTGSLSGLTFTKISGDLPAGLRLSGNKIIGTTFEVSQATVSTFVIRASNGTEISDRTFTITVNGPDEPIWLTPSGNLKVNPNGQAFILDNTFIDFQLSAVDNDLPTGENLKFYIQEGDGFLPPGLTLTEDGRITGLVDPILALDISAGTGYFDVNLFDSNPYDFGERPRTGFSSYYYDSYVYDFFDTVTSPRKLNRYYEFKVTVSDFEYDIKRTFKIYVVGDDFLRADNAIMQAGTGTFTADNTYLRAPVWLTASNLGVRRANNYVTIFLDTFDPIPEVGPLVYDLVSATENWQSSTEYSINDIVIYNSKSYICIQAHNSTAIFNPSYWVDYGLPDGIDIDNINGELFGFLKYQPAITKEYRFTVKATKYDQESITTVEVIIVVYENTPIDQNFITILPLMQEDIDLILNDDVRIGSKYYKIIAYNYESGSPYAVLTLDQNLRDVVPKDTRLIKTYIESTLEFNSRAASKTFILSIIGEIDSVIKFITPQDLGSIRANFASNLQVEAITTVPNAVLSYRLVGGKLPPGLEFSSTGELIGKVRQFGTTSQPGLTIFDGGSTTFDGELCTFDRLYKFSILAEDQFKYSGLVQEFKLLIKATSTTLYSNLYVRPFQKKSKRDLFYNFINNAAIFTPNKIYRPSDPLYGVQYDLKMLIYAGIETSQIGNYVQSLSKNTKKKRFRLGEPKIAIARLPETATVIYEVIYLEVFDDFEIGNISVSNKIKLPLKSDSRMLVNQARLDPANGDLESVENQSKLDRTEVDRFRSNTTPVTIDSVDINISGRDIEYVYPSSITNMRNNIRNLTVIEDGSTQRSLLTENEFLPLWMLTSQNNRTAATGFIKAVPLCYCKPGEASFILENIENSGFNFTELDYEIDRFIIDSTTGNSNEQYLKFSNFKFNV